MDAGIHPTEEVIAAFNEVKMLKSLRFAVFKINESNQVIIFLERPLNLI